MTYQIDESNWTKGETGWGLRHTVCGQFFNFPWQAKKHLCDAIVEENGWC